MRVPSGPFLVSRTGDAGWTERGVKVPKSTLIRPGRVLASQPALVLLGPTGRFTASLEIQGERSAKRHPVSRGDHRTRYPKRPRLYRFDGSNLSPFDSFFCCRRVAVAASQRKKGIAFQTSDQARLPAEPPERALLVYEMIERASSSKLLSGLCIISKKYMHVWFILLFS